MFIILSKIDDSSGFSDYRPFRKLNEIQIADWYPDAFSAYERAKAQRKAAACVWACSPGLPD